MAQVAYIEDLLKEPKETTFEVTIDLAVLAQVNRGDRVEIDYQPDRTLDLFEKTLVVIDEEDSKHKPTTDRAVDPNRFVPEHKDLRERFIFAETLGSYSTLHDLIDNHSPAYRMSQTIRSKAITTRLSDQEIRALEEYREQIHDALIHANQYLLDNVSTAFTSAELQELNQILSEAKERFETVTAILGKQLLNDVESAVRQLYSFQEKIRTVQRSIDGIFLVDSEVMFIPTNDLIKIVNDLFKAVGNPFVAEHIDGMLLLAARNLLIDAVSFYSFYGREQIYNVFRRNQTRVNRAAITHQIRSEIRKLFRACTANNRLVLRRVMDHAEREFEISIEAIQAEAERTAIAVVHTLIPEDVEAPPPPPPPTLMKRLRNWLFR